MDMRPIALASLLLGTVSCGVPQPLTYAGIQTTCGNVVRAVTGSHDPTVVLSVPRSRSFVVEVSSQRVGRLESLDGRLERVRAGVRFVRAECSSPAGSYRFDIRGSRTGDVVLQLLGVGPAQLVVEHDGRVLRRTFVDVSAEESVRIAL